MGTVSKRVAILKPAGFSKVTVTVLFTTVPCLESLEFSVSFSFNHSNIRKIKHQIHTSCCLCVHFFLRVNIVFDFLKSVFGLVRPILTVFEMGLKRKQDFLVPTFVLEFSSYGSIAL